MERERERDRAHKMSGLYREEPLGEGKLRPWAAKLVEAGFAR